MTSLWRRASSSAQSSGSDAPWLAGYSHVLMGLCDFLLAHDVSPSFDAVSGGFRFGTSEKDRGAHTKRLIATGIKDANILDTKAKVIAMGSKIWDAYKELGDRSENINRAALYEQLKAKGIACRRPPLGIMVEVPARI